MKVQVISKTRAPSTRRPPRTGPAGGPPAGARPAAGPGIAASPSRRESGRIPSRRLGRGTRPPRCERGLRFAMMGGTTADTARMSTSQYPHLLEPFRLRHVTFRNRLMSTSHAPGYVEDRHPKLRYQLYHEEKAKGGLALTMFGGSSNIAPDSPSAFGQIWIGDDSIVPVLREFSERVHRHGCTLMCQITHMGHRTLWNVEDWLPPIAAVAGARARPSLVPQGDGPGRHPAGGAGIRGRRGPLPGRRARRRRAPRLRASHPPVLDAARQPAHRRIRRKPREPRPLRGSRSWRRCAGEWARTSWSASG